MVLRSVRVALVLLVLCSGSRSEVHANAQAPVYVPLDSWIYPAFRRLSALGYAPDLEHLVAPWSRSECVMLLEEVKDLTSRRSERESDPAGYAEALRLLPSLSREFASDVEERKLQIVLESVYTQMLPISGRPLNDSYHFGQTVVNNFGRPYGQGLNSYSGLSAFATLGPVSAYFRGEAQTSAANQPYASPVPALLATLDGVPSVAPSGITARQRFTPLEMYLGVKAGAFNVTFGKQSLWWGPGEASAFAFTDNSAAPYSLKIAQGTPWVLPGVLRHLGHIRTQFVLGQLSGNTSPPRPFFNAQKITFQLTENLEIGFTRSALFGGVGHPLTTDAFLRSFFSTSSTGGNSFGARNDPGDRRGGFDFLWRLPRLERFVSLYSDSLADDEPNPIASPRRSAWAPGLYFPRLFSPKVDLRLETYSTWLYRGDAGGRFFYWNTQYRDAYTNNGNLLGSWIGRDARAYLATSTFWWSADRKITAAYKQIKTGSEFIPGGGTQTDVSLRAEWAFTPFLRANASGQWERIFIPALGNSRTDVAVGLGLTYAPGTLLSRH
jgi:hypothetical protein